MLKVGDKEVFLSTTIFIPEDETATIILAANEDEDSLVLKIKFEVDEEPEEENEKLQASFFLTPEVDMDTDTTVGVLTFRNWLTTFGSSIPKPVFFAKTDRDEEISLIGNIVKLGSLYKVELQFMKGGDRNA